MFDSGPDSNIIEITSECKFTLRDLFVLFCIMFTVCVLRLTIIFVQLYFSL